MADDKIYTPEVLEPENPLEDVINVFGNDNESVYSSSSNNKEVKSTNTKVDRQFPETIVARETVSQSLDTLNRRILGNFTFGEVGALQVGSYKPGESGDIRITPNGITARNVNGENTFSIDGTTGDATFKGTIQADTVISGQVIVGNNSWIIDGDSTNPSIILYNSGTPALFMGIA